jgi:hypothetical protein
VPERELLAERRVDEVDVGKLLAPLALQLGLHVLDDPVVFGVRHEDAALLGDDAEDLPQRSAVDHHAGLCRGEVGGEHLHGRSAVLDRLPQRPQRVLGYRAAEDRVKREVGVGARAEDRFALGDRGRDVV